MVACCGEGPGERTEVSPPLRIPDGKLSGAGERTSSHDALGQLCGDLRRSSAIVLPDQLPASEQSRGTSEIGCSEKSSAKSFSTMSGHLRTLDVNFAAEAESHAKWPLRSWHVSLIHSGSPEVKPESLSIPGFCTCQ